MRVDTCPHRGEEHWVTSVLATLETPSNHVREITFSFESQACGHEEES